MFNAIFQYYNNIYKSVSYYTVFATNKMFLCIKVFNKFLKFIYFHFLDVVFKNIVI